MPNYIRPTQGLSLRKAGGTMQVNPENIGGRLIVLEEMHTHKSRMRDIKPAVNVAPPWGHQHRRGRAVRSARRADGMVPAAATSSRPQSARTSGRPATAGPAQLPPAEITDVAAILPSTEAQDSYLAFVDLLVTLTTEQSRQLLESAYRDSEERKLLDGYTGVFPTLVDSDDEPPGDQPQPPQQRADEAQPAAPPAASPGAAGMSSPSRQSEGNDDATRDFGTSRGMSDA